MQADFPDLLDQHMRRIRASASAVAIEIGMSREAVNNWRRGYSKPSKKHRDKVVACSNYLRLSEIECNQLLASVGFADEFALFDPGANSQYQALFDQLEQTKPYPILMVLTQAHLDQPPQKQLIIEAAKVRYPEHQTMHVQLPYSNNIAAADFFQFIGSQLGLDQVTDELSFEFAFNDLLSTQKITLIITRFEQGNLTCRNQLSGILRNLCEMHVGQIQLILCGGEQLSALKYAQGDLSLLNIATAHLMEFDLMNWLCAKHVAAIDSDVLQQRHQSLFECIGKHPSLASSLCQSDNDHISPVELVMNSDVLFCDYNQVIQHNSESALELKLNSNDLGPYRPYLQDNVLRKLFWLNLIRKDDNNQLQWQSEPIRQFGLNLLAERKL